jgi:arylsulfatase A-like enzyme
MKTSTPRIPLLLAGLLAAVLFAPSAEAAASRSGLPDTSKMNVLFVIIEDCYAGVWGSYGNTICQTPNMDRFTQTAVRFDRAYVQAIACNPSRTSFLSGLRPMTSGVWNNSQVMSERLPAGTRTLPELLKRQGFHTAVIGKFFHTTDYAGPQLMAFDRIEHYQPPPGWKGVPPIGKATPAARAAKKQAVVPRDSPEFRKQRRQNSDRYGDSGKKTEEEGDYQNAQTAVALFGEFAKSKQRFFLSVHQSRPHTPLIAPKKYIDMYDPAKIPLPPAPPESLKDFPYAKRAAGGNPDIFTERQPTPQQTREAIAAYYACVTFVDDNMGIILKGLERQGLADNTIVFVLGDHGWHLGDHGMWSKYSMLEPTRRAPLWVRVPGAPANGRAATGFVEFVDFIPTLGDLVGLEVAPNLEGTSFAPLLVNPDRPWKSAVFQVHSPDELMVRNARYSYLDFKKGSVPAALYDLEKDPWETINLANDPAHAKTRTEMAALLQAGWKAGRPTAGP